MSTLRLVEIRRVSTEEQARDDRSGLARQAESNRRTAKRIGATIIEPPIVVTDVCRENFIDTPEWKAIRTLIKAPDVHIVVDMQDRIAGAFEGLPILIECKKTNTLIYHSQGVTDPTTFAGQLLATVTALAAGNELATIRHRAQGGKEAKRREGIFASPDAALATGIAYLRTKGKREGVWAYNEKISVVREVYRLVVEEGLRNWNEVARRAGATNNVTVRNMLTNPIYKGWWIVDEKRDAGPTPIKPDGRRKDRKKVKRAPDEIIRKQVFRPKGSPHDPADKREEALIDEATWDLVQTIVDEKRRDYYRPREPPGAKRFVYSGFLWCAGCGSPLWSKTRRSPSGHRDYYACKQTQAKGTRCALKYLRRDQVNTGLDRLFTLVFADDRFLQALVEEGLRGEAEDFSARIAERAKELSKLNSQRDKLLDLYLDPTNRWNRAVLDERAAKVDGEIERAERDLRQLHAAQQEDARANVLESLRDVLLTLSEFDFWQPKQKRDLLARFFPRIELSDVGVETVVFALPTTATLGATEVPLGESSHPLKLRVGMAWAQLVPAAPIVMSDFGLPERTLYTRSDIKTLLGLSESQFADRLRKGLIPAALTKHWGKRAWSADQMREILGTWRSLGMIYRWGLPKKAFYTTTDLEKILGVGFERIRHLIDAGKVTDCERRNGKRHRMWTEAEVERAVDEFSCVAAVMGVPR